MGLSTRPIHSEGISYSTLNNPTTYKCVHYRADLHMVKGHTSRELHGAALHRGSILDDQNNAVKLQHPLQDSNDSNGCQQQREIKEILYLQTMKI